MLAGCSHAHTMPPGAPPTPISITPKEPGGDAFDPQSAALDRLVHQPWGWRTDKREAFHFPLTDSRNWRRVRFFGVPTFVGFRYGDRHRAIAGMRVTPVQHDDPPTPEVCLQRFFEWGQPIADGNSAHVTDQLDTYSSWRSRDDVLVRTLQAEITTLLSGRRYFAVVGAMLPWPGICAMYGYAFEVGDAEELARTARDRYAKEAYSQLVMLARHPPSSFELR